MRAVSSERGNVAVCGEDHVAALATDVHARSEDRERTPVVSRPMTMHKRPTRPMFGLPTISTPSAPRVGAAIDIRRAVATRAGAAFAAVATNENGLSANGEVKLALPGANVRSGGAVGHCLPSGRHIGCTLNSYFERTRRVIDFVGIGCAPDARRMPTWCPRTLGSHDSPVTYSCTSSDRVAPEVARLSSELIKSRFGRLAFEAAYSDRSNASSSSPVRSILILTV